MILTAYGEPLEFALPVLPPAMQGWRRIVDTSLRSPQDFQELATATIVAKNAYAVASRTVVVLMCQVSDQATQEAERHMCHGLCEL